MYDTVVTEDGRLAIVLRLPHNKRKVVEVPEYREPIVIEYDEPVIEEDSRVIIIDIYEDDE